MKKFLTLCIFALTLSFAAEAQSTFTSNLPVKPRKGTTLSGVVECDGKPLQGVAVSDGYEIVTTDKQGCYYINSAKKNGYVFVIIPSGYEAMNEDAVPQLWAEVTEQPEVAERHDFALRKVDNKRHAVMAITDIHLANNNEDMRLFKSKFMPRLREEVEKYRSQGIPVYTVCMGDSSFDMYWYDFCYEITDFRTTLREVDYPTQLFHTMGNHDNDGATPYDENTDFNATEKYRKTFGPTYYSFNLGDVHYVMLDNVVYINKPTPDQKNFGGIVGSRNHEHYVSAEQLEWLKKDLALVKDHSTPIFIAMHCPVYRYKNLQTAPIVNKFSDDGMTTAFLEVLKDYTDVHFVSGHNHRNFLTYGKDDENWPLINNTIDHNIAAVCGAWWIPASHGGLTLSKEGVPAGFEVFTMDGKDMKWYYTSLDEGAEKQFRTFDLNSVREYWRTDHDLKAFRHHYPTRTDYSKVKDNVVLIHVWAWDPHWKISVKENGRELPTKYIKSENPQGIISYHVAKSVWTRTFPEKYGTFFRCPHIFRVQTSAPDTTLEITVTDAFGKEYHETMVRPKEFSKTMR